MFSDENNGSFDASQLSKESFHKDHELYHKRTLSSVLQDGVFHNTGGEDEYGVGDTDLHIDLSEDSDYALDESLDQAIYSARSEGLSDSGAERLRIFFKGEVLIHIQVKTWTLRRS